jgi:LPXTG-motif cell wall-anchored protein
MNAEDKGGKRGAYGPSQKKMKRISAVSVLSGASAWLFLTGTVLCLQESAVRVANRFSTGYVDICLKEYQEENGRETVWETAENILPGQRISKIPRIENRGNRCYIRAEIAIEGTEEITVNDLYGMEEGWISAGGMYYYTQILETGETVELFRGVQIPAEFDGTPGGDLQIRIDVDAIQADHFTPDYGSEDPWGEVEILEQKKNGDGEITTWRKAENRPLRVVYLGEAGGLMASQEDFFSGFPALMPGGRYEDTAELVNSGEEDVRLYFRAVSGSGSILPERLGLKITCRMEEKEEVIYEGKLKAASLEKSLFLGVIPAGKQGSFRFTLTVPADLDNAAALTEDMVTWIFSTEPSEGEVPPETGDSGSPAGVWLLLSGTALGGLTLVVRSRRRNR